MSSNSQVHFSSEEAKSVKEIGEFLQMIGEKLVNEGSFSLQHNDNNYTIAPDGATKLELKYQTKGDKHEFEIEVEWKPGSSQVKIN